jgi:Tol biopolymer transport system component
MRTGRVALVLVALSLPAGLIGQPQSSTSADVQLKAAMQAELVDGDLRKAIDEYRAIVSRHTDNRKVVAAALLQLAGCYEKLGQADARKTYEQLVREYADQAEPAARARARLAALGGLEPAAAPAVSALPRPDVVNDIQSLSPDGTKALFLRYDSGQNLAVYDFASRQLKPITNFGLTGFYADGGVWSPDGRRVAYAQGTFSPDGIAELRVATLAGDSRVILRNAANPGRAMLPAGWLPDGRTLLAALERADGTAVIGLIPDAGGTFMSLRSFAWSGRAARPRVSPDGRFVAFAEGAAGMQDIQVLRLDGSAAHRITDRPGDDTQPMWSPDGRHLVFISARPGDVALWEVPIKDGQAAGEPVRVKDGMDGAQLIDWTARGLAYTNRMQTLDIYTAPIDRASWQPDADPRPLAYSRTGRNTAPVWSPDGRSFAFVSGSVTDSDRRYVVVLPEGRGDAREYLIPTTRYGNALEPYDLRWFGDSSGLGFSGVDRQGQAAVFQLSIATGQWKTHPSPVKTWTRIEWNGDGTKFFYARHGFAAGAPAAIIERDLASNREREVYRSTDTQVALRGFRLSPDRRSLAFTTTAGPTAGSVTVRLIVTDLETGQARTMVEEKGGSTFQTTISLGAPAWTPDGRALIVPRTTGTNVWPEFRIVPLDGSANRSFVLNPALARQHRGRGGDWEATIREAMWSPDGTRMAFMLASFQSDTWMMENVLAGVGSPRAASRR